MISVSRNRYVCISNYTIFVLFSSLLIFAWNRSFTNTTEEIESKQTSVQQAYFAYYVRIVFAIDSENTSWNIVGYFRAKNSFLVIEFSNVF